METCLMYLAGAMTGLPEQEQIGWRNYVKDRFESRYDDGATMKRPVCFNPAHYYPIEDKRHTTEREAYQFDMNVLRKADLVIVNFNKPDSIGTAMELAVANELRIPVIGWQSYEGDLHPWLCECTMRMCNSMDEAINYVLEYFLE